MVGGGPNCGWPLEVLVPIKDMDSCVVSKMNK